jgi:hypothetical protein
MKYKPMNSANSRRTRDIPWNHQLLRAYRHVSLLLRNEHLATIQEEHLVEEVRHTAADGKYRSRATEPAVRNFSYYTHSQLTGHKSAASKFKSKFAKNVLGNTSMERILASRRCD